MSRMGMCAGTGQRRVLAVALSIALALVSGSFMMKMDSPGEARAATENTLTEVFDVSSDELVSWLESHEEDDYYLGTPYRPYDWRSPNGDINGYGANSDGVSAGMNCTGFVWHAICAAHGFKDGIGSKVPAMTGWAELIAKNELVSYTYESKKDLLAGGKLKKGEA